VAREILYLLYYKILILFMSFYISCNHRYL